MRPAGFVLILEDRQAFVKSIIGRRGPMLQNPFGTVVRNLPDTHNMERKDCGSFILRR